MERSAHTRASRAYVASESGFPAVALCLLAGLLGSCATQPEVTATTSKEVIRPPRIERAQEPIVERASEPIDDSPAESVGDAATEADPLADALPAPRRPQAPRLAAAGHEPQPRGRAPLSNPAPEPPDVRGPATEASLAAPPQSGISGPDEQIAPPQSAISDNGADTSTGEPARRQPSPPEIAERSSTVASGISAATRNSAVQPAVTARPRPASEAAQSDEVTQSAPPAQSDEVTQSAPPAQSDAVTQSAPPAQSDAVTPGPVAAAASQEASTTTRASVPVAGSGEITILLPGDGWIYLGREHGDGTVEFLRKRRITGGNEFTFRIPSPGSYRLWFQQQDSIVGTVHNERVAIAADPASTQRYVDVSQLPARQTGGTSSGSEIEPSQSPPSAYRLAPTPGAIAVPATTRAANGDSSQPRSSPREEVARGNEAVTMITEPADFTSAASLAAEDPQAALTAYLAEIERTAVTPDAAVLRAVAELAETVEAYLIAAEYWRRLGESDAGAAADASLGVLRSTVALGDPGGTITALDALAGLNVEAPAGLQWNAAEVLEATHPGRAASLYAEYVKREPGAAERDEALVALARLLESEGPQRNLRDALETYRVIRDEYPLSEFWDEANARYEHLRRHFFDIR